MKDYKAIFFDFDDTLCVRIRRKGNPKFYQEMFNKNKEYYLNEDVFRVSVGSQRMIQSVHNCKIFCLTRGDSNIVYTSKKAFLDTHYPDKFDDLFIVGTLEGKIELMTEYAKAFGIPQDKILLVDDHPDVRLLAYNAGFGIMSATEMAVLFN